VPSLKAGGPGRREELVSFERVQLLARLPCLYRSRDCLYVLTPRVVWREVGADVGEQIRDLAAQVWVTRQAKQVSLDGVELAIGPFYGSPAEEGLDPPPSSKRRLGCFTRRGGSAVPPLVMAGGGAFSSVEVPLDCVERLPFLLGRLRHQQARQKTVLGCPAKGLFAP
jgi:hypothetical protein